MGVLAWSLDRLRRIRWWLLTSVLLLLILVQDEWGWWLAVSGPVAWSGFWIPGLVDLLRDWSPSARRARSHLPSEKERIEAARQELMRRHNVD